MPTRPSDVVTCPAPLRILRLSPVRRQSRPLAQNARTTATLLNFVECDLWDGRARIPFMPISPLQSGTDAAADVETKGEAERGELASRPCWCVVWSLSMFGCFLCDFDPRVRCVCDWPLSSVTSRRATVRDNAVGIQHGRVVSAAGVRRSAAGRPRASQWCACRSL